MIQLSLRKIDRPKQRQLPAAAIGLNIYPHLAQKPYSCNFNSCAKRYTDPSSLRKHLRTHKARSGATCSGAETMGVVASNPSIQVSVLTSDFDPNSFLDQVSPLSQHQQQLASTETTSSYTTSLALNPSSSGQFIDPNESFIYNSNSHGHSHSQASSGALSNVNQATGSDHSTYYPNYHNQQQQQQTSTNHNQDLHFQQQQHHDHDQTNNNLQQQQHLQFSRSWCAGYTPVRPSNVYGSNPSLTSELSSNHVHWNQASDQASSGGFANSTSDPNSRRLSSQNVVAFGSPPRYTTSNKEVLEQHENLMRSLPHTSSSGALNRNPFGGQQRAMGEKLCARFESWNQNSNAHAQAGGRGMEEDEDRVAREHNNNNNINQRQRFSRANYSMDQVAQWQLCSCSVTVVVLSKNLAAAAAVYLSWDILV